MTSVNIEVFTSRTCPHCPAAVDATRELLSDNPDLRKIVRWRQVSTATSDGSRKARKYGIRSVPTIIITNTETGEVFAVTGAPSKNKYRAMVNKAAGKEIENEKEKKPSTSYVDKFRDLF